MPRKELENYVTHRMEERDGTPVDIRTLQREIREVNFYTGAFPTDRGNALSSVLDFKLRDGDMEHNSLKATLGARCV